MNKTNGRRFTQRIFSILPLLLSLCWSNHGIGDTIALPDIGGSDQTILTPQREREIGEAIMQELRRKHAILEGPEVEAYIQGLGHRLASNSDDPHQRFTFFTVKDYGINAFAAPGGYVGVNAGLILAAETESELAAVLAHEIAHVTQRHITRSYAAMDRLAIPSIAAMAAAILIGTQNGEAGMAALAATQAGAAQYQVDMIRSNEKEADRVGIQTLAKAGLDPRSMPVFFERLQTAARYYGKPPEFLSTHPVTVSRIADSRNRAEQFPYRQYADSKSFYLVRAKLQVLEESNKEKLVLRFRKALDTGQYRSKLAARYGYALALKQAKKLKEARDVLRRLSKEEPDRISFLHELADIELAMGNATTAMSILEKGLALYPNSKMLVQGYARALLRVGQPNRALRLLTDYTHTQPPDPAIYWMLARCEEQAGNPIAAHISLGEYYFLMGDIAAAIDQLKRAKKQEPDDYYQASRIEARLKQLKTEAALRKKDK